MLRNRLMCYTKYENVDKPAEIWNWFPTVKALKYIIIISKEIPYVNEKAGICMKVSMLRWGIVVCTIGFLLFAFGLYLGRTSRDTVVSVQAASAVLSANVEEAEVTPPASLEETPVTLATKVNINTADLEQLQALDGIGPALAQRIINYRQTYGLFRTVEEIQDVKGIGTGIFAKIKDYITVE